MGKAAVALAAAVVGLGVLSQPDAAKAQPYTYPPERVDWTVGPGYFGFSGYRWPGPPFAWPTLRPTYGCYSAPVALALERIAWREGRVCS